MSEPFLAEIRIVGFDFAPRGWALCDGQLLPISQNQSLYSLMGTTYGGDGRTTFALPDLRGRTPVHLADEFHLGARFGEERHTLQTSEIPRHTHVARASSADATAPIPNGAVLAKANNLYHSPAGSSLVALHPQTLADVPGNASHENMQPFLVLNYVIALQGLFPSRP